jgi:DsbC/DsbD-like thiol-disulfide interchange protein
MKIRFPALAVLAAAAALSPLGAGRAAVAQLVPPVRLPAPREPRTGEEAVRVQWAVVGDAKPGAIVRVAATFAIHPKWHIYWINPGESGAPTRLSIELPEGCRPVAERKGRPVVDHPAPQVIRHSDVTIGYEGEVTLSFAVRLPDALPEGGLPARVKADWLVCRESCLLGSNAAEIDLARPVAADDPAVARLAESLRTVPTALPAGWKVSVVAGEGDAATLVVALPGDLADATILYLPLDTPGVALAEGVVAETRGPEARIPLTIARDEAPEGGLRAAGVIVVGNGGGAHAFDLPVPVQ